MERPNIKEITKRLKSTSKGGWELISNYEIGIHFIEMTERPYGDYLREVMSDEDYSTKLEDMSFIANSKKDIKDLLEYIQHLESKL